MFQRVGREGGPDRSEFLQLPFLLFAGISTLTHLGVPSSLHNVLDGPILVIWTLMLIVGSAAGIVGICWWGNEVAALLIEEIGLMTIVGATLIYIVVLISLVGHVSGVGIATSFIAAFGVQFGWRVVDIFRYQRKLLELSRAIHLKDGE